MQELEEESVCLILVFRPIKSQYLTMKRKTRISSLQKVIYREREGNKTIGFIPTMGALHPGHISLIKESNQRSDLTVASIFINPAQFNDPRDLKRYPRSLKSDLNLLSESGTDIAFTPSVREIYPKKEKINYFSLPLNGLDDVMEGKFRPGHFRGMVKVVKRLLDIVQPDHLYMGQKDFQQFTIIQYMINLLQLPVQLVVCPIIREENGLAMSSRNELLSPAARKKSGFIYQTLCEVRNSLPNQSPSELCALALNMLKSADFSPEYFEIVDGHTLREIHQLDAHEYVVACTAVRIENVRLIDNLILKDERNR